MAAEFYEVPGQSGKRIDEYEERGGSGNGFRIGEAQEMKSRRQIDTATDPGNARKRTQYCPYAQAC